MYSEVSYSVNVKTLSCIGDLLQVSKVLRLIIFLQYLVDVSKQVYMHTVSASQTIFDIHIMVINECA